METDVAEYVDLIPQIAYRRSQISKEITLKNHVERLTCRSAIKGPDAMHLRGII